jgi:hypothetical protein
MTMPIFWILVGLLGLVVVLLPTAAVLNTVHKRRLRRAVSALAETRRGWTYETFARDFEGRTVPAEILRAVYERFQPSAAEHHGVAAFPVRAADVLEQVYDARLVDDWNDVMDEDLERLVRDAAAACGRRVPEPEERITVVPIRTVRDVVEYLERCPTLTNAAEGASTQAV